jgi:molybdopterin-guanine dinucleotide biosynthesis protein A
MPRTDTQPAAASLYGLVLAGGLGIRLGRDKGEVDYHGMPQAAYTFALLARHCERTRISVRDRKQAQTATYRELPVVTDAVGVEGPGAGLIAAFRLAPRSAWLVVAADMPFVDDELLASLVAERDIACLATAFLHPDGTPEPLCTIWEPASLPLLESSPVPLSLRRLLEGAGVRRLVPRDPTRLTSVNTVAEEAAARARLAAARRVV